MIIWRQKSPYVYSGVMSIIEGTELSIELMALTGAGWEMTASAGSMTSHRQFLADFLPDAKRRTIKEILDADMLEEFKDAEAALELERENEGEVTYG